MSVDNFRQKLSDHGSRWIVAILLLLPILLSVWAEDYIYFLLVMLIAGGFTWWEFSIHLFGAERKWLMGLGMAGWAFVAFGAYFWGPTGQSIGLVMALALGAGYTMGALEKEHGPVLMNLLSRFSFGHLYISFLLSFFLMLKKAEFGKLWLLYVLIVTIAADTGAYYVGRKMKGPKLYPKVSPNKTVSGLFGGAIAAMIVSGLCSSFLPPKYYQLMGLGLFLGFWGAFGDLFESAIKRAINIKDSSNILMGHGGFLDRLDSLLFNIVPVYVVADVMMNS